jgi:hypothetical protein
MARGRTCTVNILCSGEIDDDDLLSLLKSDDVEVEQVSG